MNCDPEITNKDIGKIHSYLTNNDGNLLHTLTLDDATIPYGLIDKNYFNDVFQKWEYKISSNNALLDLVVMIKIYHGKLIKN